MAGVAAALAGAVLPTLAEWAVKKIVGDAPLNSNMATSGSSTTGAMTPELALSQLSQVMGQDAALNFLREAYSKSSVALPPALSQAQITTLPLTQTQSGFTERNAQTQTLADAAAVSQYVPGGSLNPGTASAQQVAVSQNPYAAMLTNASMAQGNQNSMMRPIAPDGTAAAPAGNAAQLLNAIAAGRDLAAGNPNSALAMFQSHQTGNLQRADGRLAQAGLMQAPQPVDKNIGNQGILIAPPQDVTTSGQGEARPGSATQGVIGNNVTPQASWISRAITTGMDVLPHAAQLFDNLVTDRDDSRAVALPTDGDNKYAKIAQVAADAVLSATTGRTSNHSLATGIRNARKRASTLSRSAGQLIKKIVADAPPAKELVELYSDPSAFKMAFPSLTGSLDNYLPQNGSPEMRKIVADAVLMEGQLRKVVGDAPPSLDGMDGAMTPEQTQAAVQNINRSGAMAILLRIILEEQTLQTASYLVTAEADWREMMRCMTQSLEPHSASVRQNQASFIDGIKGLEFVAPRPVIAWVAAASTPSVTDPRATGVPVTAIVPMPSATFAPPLVASELFEKLKNLLIGASISDYSSELRLRNARVDIDSEMTAWSQVAETIAAQTGYSFAPQLLKALLYVKTHFANPGEGWATHSAGGNTYKRAEFNGDVDYVAAMPFAFPGIADAAKPRMKVCVLTEQYFIRKLGGLEEEALTPAGNGYEGAKTILNDYGIVFVRATDLEDFRMNWVRAATQMTYPLCLVKSSYANVYFVGQDGRTYNASINGVYHKPNCTYIRGPTNLMYVIIGGRESSKYTLRFGTGPNAAETYTVNSVDHTLEAPFTIDVSTVKFRDLGRKLCNRAMMGTWQRWILEWEGLFGNNSDRCSAMRLAAEHSRVYGPGYGMKASPYAGGNNQAFGQTNVITLSNAVDGDNDPYMGASFISAMANVNSSDPLTKNTVTTAMGMPVGLWKPVTSSTEFTGEVYWLDDLEPINNTITPQHVLIEYLVHKKRLHVAEEYPVEPLHRLARTSVTIDLMSNMFAAMTDAQSQVLSIPLMRILLGVGTNIEFADATLDLIFDQQYKAAIASIFRDGIQFPQMTVCTSALDNMHTYNRAALLNSLRVVWPEVVKDGVRMMETMPMSRINRMLASAWAYSFTPNDPKLALNLPIMHPKRETIKARVNGIWTPIAMWIVDICSDETGANSVSDPIINKLLSEVFWGVFNVRGNAINSNPGFYYVGTDEKLGVGVMAACDVAQSSLDTIVNTSINGLTSATQFTPSIDVIPRGQFMFTRDHTKGMAGVRLAGIGPIDAFTPGPGTSSYDKIVKLGSSFSTHVTTSYANLPEGVVGGSGLARLTMMY